MILDILKIELKIAEKQCNELDDAYNDGKILQSDYNINRLLIYCRFNILNDKIKEIESHNNIPKKDIRIPEVGC